MNVTIDVNAVSAMLSLPNPDGSYPPDMQNYLSGICQRHKVVLFSFPQKCGGTFLRSAAINAIHGQLYRGSYSQGGREAQFYLPTFLNYFLADDAPPMVTHVHMQARLGNCRFIEAMDLRPVTMIRSISDMLVSLHDMYVNEPDMMVENVSCEIPPEFPTMSHEAQADFLMRIVAPWYVAYYASWIKYALKARGRVLVLRFNDFHDHPAEVLQEVLEHSGYEDCSIAECQMAIGDIWEKRDSFRYNKGVGGRGEKFFTPDHFRILEGLMLQYPVLDSYHDELR